jgi:hypothetical protein
VIEKLQQKFENRVSQRLFTDYDVSVRGSLSLDFRGGHHVSQGARLFDVSSLTKGVTNLLLWKFFFEGTLSPDDYFSRYLSVPNVCDRKLWHFMSYAVKKYGFEYDKLRSGDIGPVKDVLMKSGFGPWDKTFEYDNVASAYMGLLLEEVFSMGIEEILHTHLLHDRTLCQDFRFHPVRRGLIHPDLVVPTRVDQALRGLVHDPFSFSHPHDHLVVAGLFSTAQTISDVFHQTLEPIIMSRFFEEVSKNQLEKIGILPKDHDYALGFDIPNRETFAGLSMDSPLIFAGWTGCRVFFAKEPRIVITILSNRVFCEDTPDSRDACRQFFREIIRDILEYVHKG